MKKKLKILHLEDSHTDSELIAREFFKAKMEPEIVVVDKRKEFENALINYKPDIILSDHSLASFDSFDALKIVRKNKITVPFILVTATVSDEFAANIIKKGAYDYILKDRLSRLPAAVVNAYEKWLAAEAKNESEERYKQIVETAQEGIWKLDECGITDFVNRKICEMIDCLPGELLGKSPFDFIIEKDKPRAKEFLEELSDNAGKTIELTLLTKRSKEIYVHVKANEIFNKDGKYQGVLAMVTDISQSKLSEKKLKNTLKELSNYKIALDESSIVAITDQKGTIVHVNENFCKISKYSRDELIGNDHKIINSSYHPKEYIRNLWRTIANGGIWKGEFRNRAKDGVFYWVETTIVPFLDKKGKPYQYISIRSDITERKNAEEKIKDSKSKLIEAQSIAHLGSWEYKFSSGESFWSKELFNIYGLTSEQTNLSLELLLSFIHPEDLNSFQNELAISGKTFEDVKINHRILLEDGSVKHVQSIIKYKLDSTAKPSVLYGTCLDITQLKRTQIELENILKELEERVEQRTKELKQTNIALQEEIFERKAVGKILETKNKEITDSIIYAQRLQKAFLPSKKMILEHFPNSFIFNKAKDILGGDFYWFDYSNHQYMICCADCTGHGVPAAFMSIVGAELLNRITNKHELESPAEILEFLDREHEKTLKGDEEENVKDGMDLAFCIINKEEGKIYFSGAINSITIVSESKAKVYKGSRFGIGKYIESKFKKFETVEIPYTKGDMLYLYTDGLRDQFGGPKDKKFMLSSQTKLFEQIAHLDSESQEKMISTTLDSWKGNNEQIDDILVIGIRL